MGCKKHSYQSDTTTQESRDGVNSLPVGSKRPSPTVYKGSTILVWQVVTQKLPEDDCGPLVVNINVHFLRGVVPSLTSPYFFDDLFCFLCDRSRTSTFDQYKRGRWGLSSTLDFSLHFFFYKKNSTKFSYYSSLLFWQWVLS